MKTSLREEIIDTVCPGSRKRREHSLCQECNNGFHHKLNAAIAKSTRGPRGNGDVRKLGVVTVAQLCPFKNNLIVHLKCLDFVVSELYLKKAVKK